MPARELPAFAAVAADVVLGDGVCLSPFVNLYGCSVGPDTRIGALVEIQRGVRVGCRCKISSHTFICTGVVIEDEVFIGHGVIFINDRRPHATNPDGSVQTARDWRLEPTVVRRGASVGSGAVILCGVEIGAGAMIGAGAVVTRDVPAGALVAGNPARLLANRAAGAKRTAQLGGRDSVVSVKMIDLSAQNREIKFQVEREMARVHAHTAYVGGPQVAAFEQEFAATLGVKHVVGVGSGTDALRLALLALGVGPGHEVITVPMTFIATAEAIIQVGARPVFVDVDPATCNMSTEALRRYLAAGRWHSPAGPRAVLPVHLYGLPAPMRELCAIAQEFQLPVLEDACQAHGARLRTDDGWAHAGALGVAGCFSFYPGKNLGAWGEAGAVATSDERLANRVAMLRDHGRTSHYGHLESGYNARLDTVQAVVLLAKLKHLSNWNARRRELAFAYRVLLRDTPCQLQFEPEDVESCYHLFTLRHPQRDAIRRWLLANGVECGIHYPLPLHLQPALEYLGYRKGDFPVSEAIADSVLSLPMHPHLNNRQILQVVEGVCGALQHPGPSTALARSHAS